MSDSTSARVMYEKSDIYETLVDDYGVFESYVDFFMFAAALGFNKNEAVRQGYGGGNEMLWMHIQRKDLYRVVAASIAYQDTGDPETLLDTKQQLEVLAQFAAAGAEIAEEEFGGIVGDPTDAVVNFIRTSHEPSQQEEDETILSNIKIGFEGDAPV